MNKAEFVRAIEDALELDEGAITGNQRLDQVEGWDSMGIMAIIAMVDERLGITLSPQKIAQAEMLSDVVGLVEKSLD